MPIQIEGEVYLTVPETARRLSMNPETVRKWIWRKKLSARRVGLQYFIRERDVEALHKAKGM